MHKYDKSVFTTELIFYSTPELNGEFPSAFCWGNQGDANFRVSLKKYVIPAAQDSGVWLNFLKISL